MEIVVRRGNRETIDQSNLSPKQKPGYLNLKIKLKLDSLFNQSVNHQLHLHLTDMTRKHHS